MSSILADGAIWILIAAGAGFCAIGAFGLFIFPDTRSRGFTALRGSLIGVMAAGVAAMIFAAEAWFPSGGDQYPAFALRVLILCGVIAAGNIALYRIIQERTKIAAGKKA
jgi:multisubunit Na+/H+ antiporter MnhG subunit